MYRAFGQNVAQKYRIPCFLAQICLEVFLRLGSRIEANRMNNLGYSFENKSLGGGKPSLELFKKKNSCPQPQFGGLTGALQDRHWVSPETFQKALGVSSTPYIGKLPPVFVALMKEFQESPKQVYQALDELAPILRGLRCNEGVFQFQVGRSQTPITLQFLGNGSFGSVYQLSFKDQVFALKVYHKLDKVSSHGTFGESSTGLYLGKRPMKDIAQFYFGNPKEGWGVYELVTKDMRSHSRSGQSIESLSLSLGDAHSKNKINGIRVDYGGISSKDVIIRDFDDYKKAMASQDPTIQAKAASNIWGLPVRFEKEAFQMAMATNNPAAQVNAASNISYLLLKYYRKEAFQMAMDTNNPTVQANAAYNISSLPEDFRKEAFQMAMDTNNPTVQANAASNIYSLPEDFRKEAFQMLMDTNNPIVRANAASNISSLPEDFRKEAFQMAMDTNNPTVQANAASMISSLPNEFIKEAFQMAMDINNPTVQINAASMILSLPNEFIKEALQMAMDTNNPTVQINAASNVSNLPDEFRKEAFQMLMDTNNPTVQANAASNISSLPEDFRKEAFQMAMDTNNSTVQASAASNVSNLPDEFRKEAFQMAMNTNHPIVQVEAASSINHLPEDFKKEAFYLAIATKDPAVLASVASVLSTLPNDFRKEALGLYVHAMAYEHQGLKIVQDLRLQ
jgi:hypothetical protein